jgi:hypothetical protein
MKFLVPFMLGIFWGMGPMLQTDPILESTSTVASAASTTLPKEGTLGFLIKRKTIKLPSVTKKQ